ncbi:hypothetical protein KKG51_02260 [Patescibacteria group bacterium]|nr:hypothetical protein [Patescibacteria group bacterium]
MGLDARSLKIGGKETDKTEDVYSMILDWAGQEGFVNPNETVASVLEKGGEALEELIILVRKAVGEGKIEIGKDGGPCGLGLEPAIEKTRVLSASYQAIKKCLFPEQIAAIQGENLAGCTPEVIEGIRRLSVIQIKEIPGITEMTPAQLAAAVSLESTKLNAVNKGKGNRLFLMAPEKIQELASWGIYDIEYWSGGFLSDERVTVEMMRFIVVPKNRQILDGFEKEDLLKMSLEKMKAICELGDTKREIVTCLQHPRVDVAMIRAVIACGDLKYLAEVGGRLAYMSVYEIVHQRLPQNSGVDFPA